jgi:16S rRNA C967 or C1407 C5-methylase (RsmB/RsmF family)/NOL1/NOP2/fmu family ribosome biogenesis protein
MKLPENFIQQVESDLPAYSTVILEGLTQKPCVSVRLHSTKKYQDFDAEKSIPWHPSAFYLPERPIFTLMPAFHAGAFYVQEPSSMLIHAFISEQTKTALDLCAAPGGKTTLLLDALGADALVVANEVMGDRNGILCENIRKWGFPNIIVTQNQVIDFQKLNFQFDLVLLDAPCSGEGMFRKDPNAIQEWSLSNVEACARRQKNLIEQAWKLVKPGGRLIYSTCTFNKKENEEVNLFLQENSSDCQCVKKEFPPAWNIVEIPIGKGWMYRCFPGLFQGEGFSVCAFDKLNEEKEEMYKLPLKKEKHNISLPKNWIRNPENYSFAIENGEITMFPKVWFVEKEEINMELKVKKAGLLIGYQKGKDFVPSHDLALSTVVTEHIPYVDLSEHQALVYLKKEIPDIETTHADGWILAKYKGLALGWFKKIGKQWKNYLPKEYRIRMEID